MIPRRRFCSKTTVGHCHACENQCDFDDAAADGGACDQSDVGRSGWCTVKGMFGIKHTCQCKYSKIKWIERKREISKYVK